MARTSSSTNATVTLSTRSVLRYPGGKFKARKILEKALPAGTTTIISPFLGGGSFELHCTGLGITVHAGDVFSQLINFWQHLFDYPQELADYCQDYLGVMDAHLFKSKQQQLIESPDSSLRSAGDFYVVNRCSFSGSTLSGGFSQASADTRLNQASLARVRDFFNSRLHVQCCDYRTLLEETGDGVLFCDPPYHLEKNKNNLYGVFGSLHKGFDHQQFYEDVTADGRKFIITYNDDDCIRKLWGKYTIAPAQWNYGMGKSKLSSDIIITNL